MNKRVVFGLPYVLALVFAVLVSSCYTPNFTSSVTSVHFDRASAKLSSQHPYLDTIDLVLMLRPSTATADVEEIIWLPVFLNNGNDLVEFVEYSTTFDGSGKASAKIMVGAGGVYGTVGKISVDVRAQVKLFDGTSFFALCTLHLDGNP